MSISFKAQSNSNEELLIRALVDDIYQIEEKINTIYDQINKSDKQKQSYKKIEELKDLRNNLIQKKISLNDSFMSNIKNNSDLIQEKLNLIKDIDDNITSMKNELISNFNTLSFKCIKLKKYILSNKTKDFLTEHQINDIILEPHKTSQNSDIQKLRRDISINKASENVIVNNYNEIISKIAQIEENLKMLKEEKMSVKYELINLISCKESLESIIKLNVNQLNIHNKINNENENKGEENILKNSNIWTKPNELFIYELMVIDSHKAANSICNQLFNVFNINSEGDSSNNNNNDILGIKKRNSKTNNNNTFNSYKTAENYSVINNNNNNYINQNKSVNEFSTLYMNKKSSNNHNNNNIYLKYNYMSVNNMSNNTNSLLNKKSICSFIQSELDKFISGQIYSYKTIYEFLENLSIILISKFQYANIIISADTLTIYLSYTFKSLYYDSIINSKLKFVNKDYKTMKKNYQKMIPLLQAESSKLNTKYQEYKTKIQMIEKHIKLLQTENNKNNKTKPDEGTELTQEEQNYLQICSKANGLIKQRRNIQKIINDYENKKNEIKKDNELMVNKINEEIKNIDKEIVKINKDIKTDNNKANKDIDYYKKIINEKYNIIKEQLQIYKDKYGSNLDIYNRLINSINNTIKRSHIKQPLIIINNNNNINNSNIFSYDINNNINNSQEKIDIELNDDNNNNNNNIKDLLLFQNDNIINNENIINTNNKEIFNLGFDISTIDKSSPYEPNYKSKEISNLSIHNISLNNPNDNLYNNNNNINKSHISIREHNLRRINEKRKVSKALSNVDCGYKTTKKNPSFEILNKTNKIKNDNLSMNNDLKDNRNKTFYSSSISGNISNKKINIFKEKAKVKGSNNSMTNDINCTSERRYDKYNKYYSNYYNHKNNKILTYSTNNGNNNTMTKHKYQSYSFMNKLGKKRLDSNSINKDKDTKDKNFHNSITKKKLGLFSYKQEKVSNEKMKLNNSTNNNINFLNKNDLNKLSNTLQNLKDTISQRGKKTFQSYNFHNQNIPKNNLKTMEKIKILTKITFCYYRENNNKSHKYNPLLDISEEYFCQAPYNFIPATISLSQNLSKISISPLNEILNKIEFNSIDIENTIVSSKIKLIIEVHRLFRKYKESSKFKSVEDFVEKQVSKQPQLTRDEIEKCAKNKNFNFSVLINGGKIIELIICSYEEFKRWINGLAFLIKNKNEIIKSINNNEINYS